MPQIIVDKTVPGCPPNNCLCYFPGDPVPDTHDPTLIATYHYGALSVDICMVSTFHYQLFMEDQMLRDFHTSQPPTW